MCSTCGCSDNDGMKIRKPGEEEHQHHGDHHHEHTHGFEHHHTHEHVDMTHDHDHQHEYAHEHDHHSHEHSHEHETQDHNHDHHIHEHGHTHPHVSEIKLEMDILHKNNLLAERNRGYFEANNIFTINLVSSPGSGKTSLLERTIKEIGADLNLYVIEGDQQTMNDANRIQAAGAPVVQVNTGNGCHLDSNMISQALKKLDVKENSLLVIENVGNLVCPAMFDLGESKRVVVISVTEGEDKPLKYPAMFQSSNICVINKTDLLPYVDFDVETCKEYAMKVNHHLEFIEVSVKNGEGMDKWYKWLKTNLTI